MSFRRRAWRGVLTALALVRRLGLRTAGAVLREQTHRVQVSVQWRCLRCYRFAAAACIAALVGGVVEKLLEADELLVFNHAVNYLLNSVRAEAAVHLFA